MAWSCGSRLYICLVVSSYKISLAPGTFFSVHLEPSAKASSALQLLFMMTPDHDPEFGFSACPDAEMPEAKKNATMQLITGKLDLNTSPPDGPHQLCSINRQLSN